MDALRLLVGRGGDAERADYYGNTALHLSAARGHIKCVTFLVNFGVNLWRQDIDQHTPQELAAMNDCHDILRYLDQVTSKMEVEEPRKVKKMQEQADKELQRLLKNFKKVQAKADRQSNKKEKELEQEKKRMMTTGGGGGGEEDEDAAALAAAAASMPRRMSTFSEMTNVGGGASNGGAMGTVRSKVMGTVFKKSGSNLMKERQKQGRSASIASIDTGFKITNLEDGKKTVRSLSGLRRDNEIMFVANTKQPTIAEEDEDGDGADVFSSGRASGMGFGIGVGSATTNSSMLMGMNGGDGSTGGGTGGTTSSSSSGGDFPGLSGARRDMQGIFTRPGFGSVAFRRSSMASTLMAAAAMQRAPDSTGDGSSDDDVDDNDNNGASDVVDDDYDGQALSVFLAGLGLAKYFSVFSREKIDLETLMLLTESNLKEMDLEIGPRKKILKAIDERKRDMQEAEGDNSPIQDSQL